MVFTRHDQEGQLPIADALALEQVDSDTYRSTHETIGSGVAPYKGKLRLIALGGCVLGQAAWAAAQTVPKELVIHVGD